LHKFRRPNSLKIVPSGVANSRNLPFGRRATRGSRVRLPREEGTWSRHQCLFEENIRKIETCGLRTLSVKGWGNMTSKLRIFPFLCFYVFSLFMFFSFFMGLLYFLSFCGRQGCFPRSYVSSILMRKSDLHSSFRTKRWLSCFYLFSQDIF